MIRFFILLSAILCAGVSPAQVLPYTQAQYEVAVYKNIVYGVAVDFAGVADTLRLDIYKPLNNTDISRPVYLHAHGGSWLEISNKNGAESAAVCTEMAKRGYVAANIEYRRGFHRVNFYNPYALCSALVLPNNSDCIYAQDSSEIIRAVYRGMQDFKGAIRYMKSRHLTDSTDVQKVVIGGESAGGFLALYTGLLDCPNEKPLSCNALPDALPTDGDLLDCNIPNPSLVRPDLGDVEGDLHINSGYNADVKGVANFFGGVFHPLWRGLTPPALYLFHQTNDAIVDCGVKSPMRSFYEQVVYPLNLCQPLVTIPVASGSCAIQDQLSALGAAAPAWNAQIVNNGPPFALANPNGHAYDNIGLRAAQMAAYFSPYLTGAAALPPGSPCQVTDTNSAPEGLQWSIAPNPIVGDLSVQVEAGAEMDVTIRVYSSLGRLLRSVSVQVAAGRQSVLIEGPFAPGIYFVQIGQTVRRVVAR